MDKRGTTMKSACMLAALLIAAPLSAQTQVQGHWRKDGTYVQPHTRTNPNNSTYDNWSSKPNYNPYTGQQGTQNPQPQPYQWKPIQTQPAQPYRAPPAPQCPPGSFLC